MIISIIALPASWNTPRRFCDAKTITKKLRLNHGIIPKYWIPKESNYSLHEWATPIGLVYYVHSFYVIREDVIDRKNTEEYWTFYLNSEKNSRFCIACEELATKIVKYDTEGAIILEKYCDNVLKQLKIVPKTIQIKLFNWKL
jgi:hypothetical protein